MTAILFVNIVRPNESISVIFLFIVGLFSIVFISEVSFRCQNLNVRLSTFVYVLNKSIVPAFPVSSP